MAREDPEATSFAPQAAHRVTWRETWPIAVPALLALVVYLRAPWLGLSWDDAPLTVDSPSLGSWHGLWTLWTEETWKASGLDEQTNYYRPLAMTSFWLVARIANTAAAHHSMSVLIHAGNAALVARALMARTKAAPVTACLLASFWALATANSEAVVWISGRFDALVTTFLLAAFLANGGPARRRWLVALWFGCALLTKEVALAWLPVVVADDLALRRDWRESWRRWAVLVALAIGYLAMRRGVGIATGESVLQALGWLLPAFASIVLQVVTKLFVPLGLGPLQPLHLVPVPAAVAILGVAAALAALVARRSREHESPASTMLVGISWFLLTLVPMAVIPPSEPVAGDRYGYAASVGIILVLAALTASLREGRARRIAQLAACMLVVVHGVLTELRIPAWQDRETIAASMVREHPENAHAHYLLGYVALERRDLVAADAQLTMSLAIDRSWRALDAACVLELRRGHLDLAEQYCKESALLDSKNPRVWVNLASVCVKGRRWQEALDHANRAIALKPRYAEAHYLAAVSAANSGLLPLAMSHIEDGLSVNPTHRALLRLREDVERGRRAHPSR